MGGVTYDPAEVGDRLVTPDRLLQVAAMLSVPLQETDGLLDALPQATLYAKIAAWARLSALAADRPGEPGHTGVRRRFAYLVEYAELYTDGWQPAPGEHAEGIVPSPGPAETVVLDVLGHYVEHLAAHPGPLWMMDELALRASVWDLETAVAPADERLWLPDEYDFPVQALLLNASGVPPQAVVERTPAEVYRLVAGHVHARETDGTTG